MTPLASDVSRRSCDFLQGSYQIKPNIQKNSSNNSHLYHSPDAQTAPLCMEDTVQGCRRNRTTKQPFRNNSLEDCEKRRGFSTRTLYHNIALPLGTNSLLHSACYLRTTCLLSASFLRHFSLTAAGLRAPLSKYPE